MPTNFSFSRTLILVAMMSLGVASCGGGGGATEAPQEETLSDDTQFVYVERDLSSTAASSDGNGSLETQFANATANSGRSPVDLRSPYEFNPGARLVNRSGLSVEAMDQDVLADYFGTTAYDVKDLNVSPDGERVVFAAHGPSDSLTDYTWNIYEYDFESEQVRRIIGSDALANAGQDTSPTYTAEGTIIFSTDRAAGNPDKPVPTIPDSPYGEDCYKVGPDERPSLLHSMTSDGERIIQLTFGNNHDVKPITLRDGRVAFIRWSRRYELVSECSNESDELAGAASLTASNSSLLESVPPPTGLSRPDQWPQQAMCQYTIDTPLGAAIASNHYSLLRIDAEGETLEQLYKTVSLERSDEVFMVPDQLVQSESGQLLTLIKHQYNQFHGGDILELQAPEAASADTLFGGFSPRSLISSGVDLYPNQRSQGGWYSAVAPYRDGTGRLLVSWSQCAVEEGGVNEFCRAGLARKAATESGCSTRKPIPACRLFGRTKGVSIPSWR